MVLNLDGNNEKLTLGEKILFLTVGVLVTFIVGYFVWAIGEGIYRQYNPIEWTATVEELEPGILDIHPLRYPIFQQKIMRCLQFFVMAHT